MTREIYHGTVEDYLADCEPESFDLIHADPPYFRVLAEEWDRQWSSRDAFLEWLGGVLDGFQRVLKPNGSLYLWTSAAMAAGVEERVVRPRFQVLSAITWAKAHANLKPGDPRLSSHKARDHESLRTYFDETERCIFAEHHGADGVSMRESGYGAKIAGLRSDVFGPLRSYLVDERDAAGVWNRQVDEHLGTSGMARHYFSASQWALPTLDVYGKLRELFNANGDGHLRREYEDLRREYEDRRREYEDLRRPFHARRDGFTNVWTYAPAELVPGRHPAEKPLDMMRDIVRASTREGARVLDAFAGSGSMSAACVDEGCDVVAVEMDGGWCDTIRRRCDRHAGLKGGALAPAEMAPITGPLFGGVDE